MSNRSLLIAAFLALTVLMGASAQPTPAPASSSAPASTTAPAAAAPTPTGSLDDRIQDAKSAVIRLNRDLMVLEEELLFPANTQVAIFVSMDVGKMFLLDSVRVKLDGKDVAGYLYTPAEVQALHRGGVQRLYLGNLKSGTHELVKPGRDHGLSRRGPIGIQLRRLGGRHGRLGHRGPALGRRPRSRSPRERGRAQYVAYGSVDERTLTK